MFWPANEPVSCINMIQNLFNCRPLLCCSWSVPEVRKFYWYSKKIFTFDSQNNDIDEENPYSGILAAMIFASIIMYHNKLQAMSCQLVFGHDACLVLLLSVTPRT